MLSEDPSFGQRLQPHARRERQWDVADKRVVLGVCSESSQFWGAAETDSKDGFSVHKP